MKQLSTDQPIDSHLKPVKDSDGTATSLELSTEKVRVKDLEITGTTTGISAGMSDIVEDTSPQLGGDLDLNSNSIDFPTTANISDCKDEDDMDSNSATMLATQQSIKAYADAPQYILHFLNVGWTQTSGSQKWIPLNGSTSEVSPSGSAYNEYAGFVVPYDGELEQVLIRSEYEHGSSAVSFHKSSNGTESPNTSATETITVSMGTDDTTTAFNFTGTSVFSAGDIIAIGFDPSSYSSSGDCNATIILKFDTTQCV